MAVDIVEEAEKVILKIKNNNKGKIYLTTSQIRKFLTAVNLLKNKIEIYRCQNNNTNILSEDLTMEIKFMRINIVYQVGKDNSKKNLKEFVETAQLENWIKNIGNSVVKFNEFYKYVEALVAFHKYYGGKDE